MTVNSENLIRKKKLQFCFELQMSSNWVIFLKNTLIWKMGYKMKCKNIIKEAGGKILIVIVSENQIKQQLIWKISPPF